MLKLNVELIVRFLSFFFFNDTATTEIYTLSLHDALPIFIAPRGRHRHAPTTAGRSITSPDRKSTRLNSSHLGISYAVFCLKKKKHTTNTYESKTKSSNLTQTKKKKNHT